MVDRITFAFVLSLPLISAACSSHPDRAPQAAIVPPTTTAPVAAVDPCAAVRCDEPTVCRGGACIEPTERQKQQAQSIASFLDGMADVTGWGEPLDLGPVKERERLALYQGDGSDAVFYGSLWRALNAVPEGHQSVYSKAACGTEAFPRQHASSYGVCGRLSGDEIVVTFVEAGNPLGLAPGDRVVAAGADRGVSMIDAAALRPVCGAYYPSAAARRSSAAVSFFGTVPNGTELHVVPADGGPERTVSVPKTTTPSNLDCTDPFGRNIAFSARASVRSDGTAVIRLPRFVPYNEGGIPTTQAEIDAYIAKFQNAVQTEFDKVKDAPRLVWDLRGNGGGITAVGLAIVDGMPGARAMDLSCCRARIPKTHPAQFDTQRYAEYAVTPGGPFQYAGKVAIVVDALDYSASDYFSFAIARATDVPRVGEGTAGAYGGAGATLDVEGPPAAIAGYDVNHCLDARDDSPLEGRGNAPTHPVSYRAEDAAKGIDTLLEAAVALTNQ
jgi:hypothetical protein